MRRARRLSPRRVPVGGERELLARSVRPGSRTMNKNGHYQFAIELFAPDGRRLGQVPVAPDWEPALESAAFAGIRRGRLPAMTGTPSGTVEPIWHADLGEPYVRAFRAQVACADGDVVSSEIPTAYVRALARSASAAFVASGALQAGDVFTYIVCAFASAAPAHEPGPSTALGTCFGTAAARPPEPERDSQARQGRAADGWVPQGEAELADGFAVEPIVEPLTIEETPLARFSARAVAQGPQADGDMPVFIPQSVLDEAVELSRQAGDVEAGGILIGRLHRDSTLPEVFVEITALFPAPHTVSQATKVTFTAETWSAVDAAIALRGRGEKKIAWLHSHVDWCRSCPPDKRARCTLSNAFFSADDVHLHRVCFGRAYQVALLVSENADASFTCSLFGWRRGMVEARGYHVIDPGHTTPARADAHPHVGAVPCGRAEDATKPGP